MNAKDEEKSPYSRCLPAAVEEAMGRTVSSEVREVADAQLQDLLLCVAWGSLGAFGDVIQLDSWLPGLF